MSSIEGFFKSLLLDVVGGQFIEGDDDISAELLLSQNGPDGARAFALYAEKREVPDSKKDWPRIAVIVGGLGISASGTADAVAQLPPPVTLALAPYGVELEKLAAQARAQKHEVLLQVPMEPFDYPDNDPGPQTLLTSLSADQNIDRLQWLMSRFQGYVGMLNYMGGKFTAGESSLSPVLRESAKRGLIYVDDGASTRSIASQLAGSQNLPFAKTDIVIDAVPTPTEIDQALGFPENAKELLPVGRRLRAQHAVRDLHRRREVRLDSV